MKSLIIGVILILSCLVVISSTKTNHWEKKNKSRSSSEISESYSSYYSSSNGGKPKKYVNSFSSEEYRDKNGDDAEEIRRYEEKFNKHNNHRGYLKQKAFTNVDVEDILLGDRKEEMFINSKDEKVINIFNSEIY